MREEWEGLEGLSSGTAWLIGRQPTHSKRFRVRPIVHRHPSATDKIDEQHSIQALLPQYAPSPALDLLIFIAFLLSGTMYTLPCLAGHTSTSLCLICMHGAVGDAMTPAR